MNDSKAAEDLFDKPHGPVPTIEEALRTTPAAIALAKEVERLRAENERLKAHIRDCDKRIVNQRTDLANLNARLKEEIGWVTAYRERLGRYDGLKAIDELTAERDAARAEVERLKAELADECDRQDNQFWEIDRLTNANGALVAKIVQLKVIIDELKELTLLT